MKVPKLAGAIAFAVVFLGCGQREVVKKEEPPPPPSPQETLQARFEKAYFAIACMANRGRDPTMTVSPLRRPSDYLEGLAEEKTPDLEKAMRVLQENGFTSIEAFKAVETRLRSDRDYWQTIEARFVDELLKCR